VHHKILVTVNKDDELDTSEKARRYVADYLAEEGLVDDGLSARKRFVVVKYFGYGDHFQIGGRWSGLLTGNAYDLWEMYGPWKPTPDPAVLAKVFYEHEDDAQLVSRDLYDRFLKQWEDGAEGVVPGRVDTEDDHYQEDDGLLVRDDKDGCGWDGFLDINHDSVSEAFIGRKWLVVVDLHE
jgi:hypothetical protein